VIVFDVADTEVPYDWHAPFQKDVLGLQVEVIDRGLVTVRVGDSRNDLAKKL
jgi:hypothetical protein